MMMRFRVPDVCPGCAAAGGVQLMARTYVSEAAIWWYCQHCERVWPVSFQQRIDERRSGPRDRRARTRTERRQPMVPRPKED